MIIVYKVFKGKDSIKKAVNLLCREIMDFSILPDNATRRREEQEEEELKGDWVVEEK